LLLPVAEAEDQLTEVATAAVVAEPAAFGQALFQLHRKLLIL
jgi:hypothetical protein